MKTEVRNRILFALLALVVLCVLTFSFTQARYTEEHDPDNHTGELDYTLANQLEVTTTEQFFAAIENGYSNIKIADAVSNPFLVSGSADVESDLILDLNGHEIQRNSRKPMLTIKEGVKMIVTDTAKSQAGSFYNPVGSVLNIDGGVLTVTSNKFESGPRDDEYYSNRDKTKAEDGLQYIGGTINTTTTLSVSFKNGEQYDATNTDNVPIILPYKREADQGAPTIDGKKYFVNGNIYFNNYTDHEKEIDGYSDTIVQDDVYLYFTIDDQNASSSTIVASTEGADFHYCYYVNRNGAEYVYAGVSPDTTDDKEDIKVTIYGYYNVLASARNEVEPYKTTPSNFAAIKMQRGKMYARGGEFYSYFGVETASCIYADEGYLSIHDGTYTALEEGAAVRCNYALGSSEFTIVGGTFKSFKGDTIHMTNGEMTITGGTFVKDTTKYTEGDAGSNNNNSAIKLDDGKITLETVDEKKPINFYLAGSYMAGIECGPEAEIHSDGVNFQFGTTNGEDSVTGGNNIGIVSQGGDVDVFNSTFIQPGNYSYGIYSYDSVGLNSVDVVSSIFSMGGERCTGIYANGGKINIGQESDLYQPNRDSTTYTPDGAEKYHDKYINGNLVKDENGQVVKEQAKGISIDNYTMFYFDHVANCYGVFVEKKEETIDLRAASTQINVYAGQFSIGSGYTGEKENRKMYAEYEVPGKARLDGQGNYIAYCGGGAIDNEADLQKAEMVWSAGVYLNDPDATVSLGRARLIIGGSYAAGIFAERGTVNDLYNKDIDISYNGTPMAKNDLPTTVFFIGTTMLGYQNGGYLNPNATEKEKKWNHLYKRDDDYYQTKNFDAYYDRILNCNSTDDYGIAAKAGSVIMGRAYVNVRSKFSRGIYATSGVGTTAASTVKLEDLIANIDNQEKDETTGKYVVPDALSTTALTIRNGNVEINNGDVRTNGVGIVINNGQLTFNGDIKLESINASAIYMTSTAMVSSETSGSGNTWTVSETAKVSIFCNIREKSDDLTTPIPWKLKNAHERGAVDYDNLPDEKTHYNNGLCMLSHNGVNILGGSFICNGELVVDFHGVDNKNQTAYDPYNIPLSSCAINVEQLANYQAPDVAMWHIHVESGKPKDDYKKEDRFYANVTDISDTNAGGGISVKGGDVFLGKSDNNFYTDPTQKGYEVLNNIHNKDYNELITIETFGNSRYRKKDWSYDYLSSPKKDNWSYAISKTGGPGIKVDAGNINVKYGTYYASQGNGIVLNGGTATVHNGIFRGKNTEWTSWESDSTGSGLGSYYGFMLRGGGNLTIYNGKFEGFNGGAFIVGSKTDVNDENTGVSSTIINTAEAYIYGGTFEDMPERRLERTTTNGFSVGPYSTVVLGKETDLPEGYVAPQIMGIACGIAVENNQTFTEGLDKVNITIQGGTLVRATKGNRGDTINAIWKGNQSATLKFGECTLLLKQQIVTKNEETGEITISEGDVYAKDQNYVIQGEETQWAAWDKNNEWIGALLAPDTYHVYEFPNLDNVPSHTETGYEVKYTWKAQGNNAFKIVISKKDLGYNPYP